MITFKEWLKNKNVSEIVDPMTFNKELAGVVNAANNPVSRTSQVAQDPSTIAKTVYNNSNPQLKKAFQNTVLQNMANLSRKPNPNTQPVTTTGMSQPTAPVVGTM